MILISVDTLRTDRLGLYGGTRPTSANLDSLARRGVVFEAAHAQAAQTAPSHGSVFTSLHVGVHGLYNVNADDQEMPVLPAGVRTLAEQLKAAGIETAAFVSDGNLRKGMDMDRGFATWDERNEDVSLRVDAFLKWLGTVGDRPFFGFLHTYQCHAPYLLPADVEKRFTDPAYAGPLRATYQRYLAMTPDEAWAKGIGADYWGPDMLNYTDADIRFLSDLYDGEICYTDSQLRRVLEAVLTGPRRDDTAIVVFGDHGEEFHDHGKFQHDQIYEELVRVPLIMFAGTRLEHQGWKGRVTTPVQLIDVAPTIAELMGVAPDADRWQGRSLVPMLRPDSRPAATRDEQPVFSEYTREHGTHRYRAVSWHGWKYIIHEQPAIPKTWEELFDLGSDPREKHNLLDSPDAPAPENLAHLRDLLEQLGRANDAMRQKVGQATSSPLSAQEQQGLRTLGYNGTASHPAPSNPPPAPARDTYTVQPGDTLAGIAARELGDAQLAGELARLNNLGDPPAIHPGQVLKLR